MNLLDVDYASLEGRVMAAYNADLDRDDACPMLQVRYNFCRDEIEVFWDKVEAEHDGASIPVSPTGRIKGPDEYLRWKGEIGLGAQLKEMLKLLKEE